MGKPTEPFADPKNPARYSKAMSETKTQKRRPIRWCLRVARRLFVYTAVAVLIGVVVFALYAWQVNTRGERAVLRVAQELQKRGLLNLYTDAIEHQDESSDERTTSAAYWRAAMEAAPEAGELPIPAVATVAIETIYPRQQYHPEMVAAMRNVVDENPLFFELIQSARIARHGRLTAKTASDELGGNMSLLANSRRIARWLQVRANLAEAEGDSDAFTDAALSICDLNNNLQDSPGIIAPLVRVSIDALNGQMVADGLSRIELDADQLGVLIKAFERRQPDTQVNSYLGNALSSEYHRVTQSLAAYIVYRDAEFTIRLKHLSPEALEWFEPAEEPGLLERLWDSTMLSSCIGRYQLINAGVMLREIERYDTIIALVGDPAKRWTESARLSEEENEQYEKIKEIDTHSVGDLALMSAVRVLIRSDSRTATLIAALQVERYRVEHGNWPAKLEDATGKQVIDARGQAIRYRKMPEGVIIYNTGDNTIDEQGYNEREYEASDQFPEADDYPVVLYNPELRNLLPPPARAIQPESDYDTVDGF